MAAFAAMYLEAIVSLIPNSFRMKGSVIDVRWPNITQFCCQGACVELWVVSGGLEGVGGNPEFHL